MRPPGGGPHVKVVPLGAGQDVGRSCVLVTLGGKTVMFDCGMHMGYQDERRYPDFRQISRSGRYTQAISAVVITHFHLDHCGSLAYFTETCGYDGPIYMTHPTRAIVPVMLEDCHKVMARRNREPELWTRESVHRCMQKVVPVGLNQTIDVDGELQLRAYYAGHVLGAAMFHARVGSESVVYTGDYNMTPDRHLGAARIDPLRPDVLITESTYATTVRGPKRSREREFLTKLHRCVLNGGKVLIPVFALGRAQELMILVDEFWSRVGLEVPVYFSAGMAQKANMYYKLLVGWTNETIKESNSLRHATFDFPRVKPWDQQRVDDPGPCVLFASPGMLHTGLSLDVFKRWAQGKENMAILPGYCVAGTVGGQLIAGKRKGLQVDKHSVIDVKCSVHYLSFSAHADAKGILQLIQQCKPKNVVLVHGERTKMQILAPQITRNFGLACYHPKNGESLVLRTQPAPPIALSRRLVDEALGAAHVALKQVPGVPQDLEAAGGPGPMGPLDLDTLFVKDLAGEALRAVTKADFFATLGAEQHDMTYQTVCTLTAGHLPPPAHGGLRAATKRQKTLHEPLPSLLVDTAYHALRAKFGMSVEVRRDAQNLSANTFSATVQGKAPAGQVKLLCSWKREDSPLAETCLEAMRELIGGGAPEGGIRTLKR